MKKRLTQLLSLTLIIFISWGCSSKPEKKQALISGNLSLSDSIHESDDYSGTGFTIIKKDSAEAAADTLFHASTDSTGRFSGTITFPERRQYQTIISRDDKKIGRTGIILADGDTISVEGELPNLSQSFSVSSREQKAMEDYQRLNKNFQRVRRYANAGLIKGDSLGQELNKWSGLYWQVYNDHHGTLGAILSAQESIRILKDLKNKKAMARLRSVDDQEEFSHFAARVGSDYLANTRGLDPALAYIDTLINTTKRTDRRMRVRMQRIKLLYDSARVDAAKKDLADFKEEFSEDHYSKEWVESMSYDLNYLSPGQQIPSFEFRQNSKTISRDSLMGSPYILEITRLSSNLYQQQFDRTIIIHSIYKNYGLQIVTIPLDKSQVTINAFFEERIKPWPVADAAAFSWDSIAKEFNIQRVPTRFLVDQDGVIIRKYVGQEYQDIIKGIQMVTDKKNKK